REEVPCPRSSFSQSSTDSPRPAASRAMPAPLMPPPMMTRSKTSIMPVLAHRPAGRPGGNSQTSPSTLALAPGLHDPARGPLARLGRHFTLRPRAIALEPVEHTADLAARADLGLAQGQPQ